MSLKVLQKDAGKTLLAFLRANLEGYSSVKSIKRAIDAKQCRINGKVEFFSTHPVCLNDEVTIDLAIPAKNFSIEILYEDETILCINKPSGRVSESLTENFLVHRLDKDTSGIMLFAKTMDMQKMLEELFAKRKIKKSYLAICDHRVIFEEWTMDNYLGRKASYQGGCIYGVVSKNQGKRAITHFRRLKIGNSASLIEAIPITGRTHQIRVHLKKKGHPVLGDWQYAKVFSCPYEPERLLLHAHSIAFIHPMTKKPVEVVALPPKDFLQAEKKCFTHN